MTITSFTALFQHDNHIIHRDLKAENVFFATPYLVKVGDFGFSTFVTPGNTLNTFCGSPPYAAPELFRDEHYTGVYVDIWALGILLYFVIAGVAPFRAETVAKLKKVILDGSYSVPSYVPAQCESLISRILLPEPSSRLSLQQIRDSEWLEGQDFPDALPRFESVPAMHASSQLSIEESEARHNLTQLGITDEHFKEAHAKDLRSHVTGTYRIILHKILKRNSKEVDFYSDDDRYSNYRNGSARPNRGSLANEKKSKTCSIL